MAMPDNSLIALENQIPPEKIGFLIGAIIGGLVAGALCGTLPLVIGLKRKCQGLAIGGFIACVIGGAILGLLLAVPLALIFTTIIMFSSKPAGANIPPVDE